MVPIDPRIDQFWNWRNSNVTCFFWKDLYIYTLIVQFPIYIWNLWLPVANISGNETRPLVPNIFGELEDQGIYTLEVQRPFKKWVFTKHYLFSGEFESSKIGVAIILMVLDFQGIYIIWVILLPGRLL